MFLRRSYAMAIAALALAGCASSGYGGSYNQYPGEVYYGGPGYGYDTDYDGDSDRYFHPARNVTCDRARDVCYDRYGLSYYATARYLGERDANRAYKHYGDQVFLFSPKRGVVCDRRTQSCSNGHWPDSGYGQSMYQGPQRQADNKRVGVKPGGSADQDYWPNNSWGNNACPPKGCSNK